MGRDDVPEQHAVLEPELGEHPVDDGRGRLGGPASAQLPLRREGDAADPGAAVARGLAEEQQLGAGVPPEVVREPLAAQGRACVLVEGGADPRAGEPLDEQVRRRGQ